MELTVFDHKNANIKLNIFNDNAFKREHPY